jgi:hypothetical protein
MKHFPLPRHASIDPYNGGEPVWNDDADTCECGEPAGSDGMCHGCSYERHLEEQTDQRADR